MVYTRRRRTRLVIAQKKIIMSTSQPSQETAGTGSSASARADPATTPVYRRGDLVDVFYRMGCDDGSYFPVSTPSAGTLRPRFGRSDGWMSARIEEDWPPAPRSRNGGGGSSNTPQMPPPRVRVRHTHPYWSNRRGERLDPMDDRDMVVFMPPSDVRRPEPGYKPAVSLFVVRWGGESTLFNVEQWGEASSSVSDSYIDFVIDRTLYSRVGPDYEVVTAYVESGSDMLKLQPSAIAPMLTGRHVCGLYFLWPVMAQDGGDAEQSGMVNQVDYFASVHSFEAAGVPTRFPHVSQVYRTLLAKEWQPALCLNGRLRVPVATIVNRATVIRSPRRAAACVMEALSAARTLRYAEGGGEPDCLRPLEGEVRRGVVKLGFAWEASHVRVFRGEAQLAEALEGLIATPGVEAPNLIVQDYVKNHLEMRCFVVDGKIAHIIYSSFERVDVDGYPRDFVKKERGAAIAHWLEGDHAAMEDAERKAARLVSLWLTWLCCQSAEPVPAIRMDILVTRSGPGRSEVHTLELTEMGFSMLAWPEGPRVVFNALIESFFSDIEHTAADATALAATRPPPLSMQGPELPRVRAPNAERLSRKERKKQKRLSRERGFSGGGGGGPSGDGGSAVPPATAPSSTNGAGMSHA